MNAYIRYRVTREDGGVVWRRYSDFAWLHSVVATKNVGVILPGLPDKAIVGRFNKDFIDLRRSQLEDYLNQLISHTRLQTDPDIKHFLEHPDDITQSAPATPRSGGFFGMIRDLQQSAQQAGWIGGKTDIDLPLDVQGEEMKAYLTALDQQLCAVQKYAAKMVQKRRDLASAYAEFGLAVNLLGNCETDTQYLATGLSQLGNSADRLGIIQHEQADEEELKFEMRVRDYIKYVQSAKDAAKGRERLLQNYHNALIGLDAKKTKLDKAKQVTPPNNSKVLEAEAEVREGESEVERAKAAHVEVCEVTRAEMTRFQQDKIQFFKGMVLEYVKMQIGFAKKDLVVWETLLPEVDGNGQ
eukprot:c40483_g1_i1.p1 GENE.c40483_g1_i1~~c40483_g1_i1.p1  ORF type:complete len:379 (-),score=107.78 c40483_g1_i1:73-1137(-)